MKINIQSELLTSTKSFFSAEEGNIQKLIVPIYQREYDWEETEIERLLSDLDEYINLVNNKKEKKGESYFTGAIILEKLNDNGLYEIVDGQQRLSTLFIINVLNYIVVRYRYLKLDHVGMNLIEFGSLQKQLSEQLILLSKRICNGNFDNSVFEIKEETDWEKNREAILNRLSGNYLLSGERSLKFEVINRSLALQLNQFIKDVHIGSDDEFLKISPVIRDNKYWNNLEIIFNFLLDNVSHIHSFGSKCDAIHEKLELYLKYAGSATIISENKNDSFKLFEVLNDTARELTILDLLKNYFVDKLKDEFVEKDLSKLIGNTGKNKKNLHKQLINDFIKSEGYDQLSKEYTYLSKPEKKKVEFFRKEDTKDYFYRLLSFSENLNLINNQNYWRSGITNNNSLAWNLSLINDIKFHWGREIMLGYFHLLKIRHNIDRISDISEWSNISHSSLPNNIPHLSVIVLSDLLAKIGIIGKVNNLSSKTLPSIAKEILAKFHANLLDKECTDENIKIYITDVKNIFSSYLTQQKSKFLENISFLNYRNNNHRSTLYLLLYLVYNKGVNHSYKLDQITLEHIESDTLPASNHDGYFVPGSDDKDRETYTNGIGNLVLMDSKKNSSLGNETLKFKINRVKTENKFLQDGFFSHPIYDSIHNKHVLGQSYDSTNFSLLTSDDNLKDRTPTTNFFINREKFYKKEIEAMIFTDYKFILTGSPYLL